MEGGSKEFVKNRLGILVVKCCASCKYRDAVVDSKKRYCRKFNIWRPKDFLCNNGWEMNESLDNAGKGGGDIKRQQYFEYISKNGVNSADEYERMYGSRYLTRSKKK